MKTRSAILAVVLVASLNGAALAAQRWCRDSLDPSCPQQSLGWMLFEDSNIGTPDFWNTESVTVQEIYRCEHGVQFLFVARQKGRLFHTALVFPKPSRVMLADRLGLEPGSARLEQEYAHYAARYEALTKSLEALSGGMLVEGGRLSFERVHAADAPVIVPHGLALHWRGQVLLLRGYLDVYFAPVV